MRWWEALEAGSFCMVSFSTILTAARCFCFLKYKRADSWVGKQYRVLQVLKIACESWGDQGNKGISVTSPHGILGNCQAPLSMGFSRKEYWSELPFPISGDFPKPRFKPSSLVSPAVQADSLPLRHLGSPYCFLGGGVQSLSRV